MTDDGELTISGGGSTQVATDIVFEEMVTLRLLQADAEGWQGLVARIRDQGLDSALTWLPGDLGACVFGASVAIDAVARRSGELADALAEAAESYGRTEDGLHGALRVLGAGALYTVGLMSRLLAPVVLRSVAGPALGAAAATLLFNLVGGRPASVLPAGLQETLRDNPQLLTNPATVAMVRVLVSSVDDFALGAVGAPLPVAWALGDDGAGLLGVQSSALGVAAAAGAAGLLRETPVRVNRVGASPGASTGAATSASTGAATRAATGAAAAGATALGPLAVPLRGRAAGGPGGVLTVPPPAPAPVTPVPVPAPVTPAIGPGAALAPPRPPTGFADLAERIPTEADGGQVRIERYGEAEHPSWLVYIGGTREWSPTDSTEPWDMASNIAAVADQDAGSYRAVLQAMAAAGVQPGDPVLPVAHSQGGLVAAELVARGDINAVGLVTFGAPASQVSLPDGVPAIAIEHTDDLIPALGGTAADGDSRLYVRRELFAENPVPVDEPLPAHQLVGYRDTARLIDGSAEPRLVAFREQLGDIVGTGAGQQSVWHADRLG